MFFYLKKKWRPSAIYTGYNECLDTHQQVLPLCCFKIHESFKRGKYGFCLNILPICAISY